MAGNAADQLSFHYVLKMKVNSFVSYQVAVLSEKESRVEVVPFQSCHVLWEYKYAQNTDFLHVEANLFFHCINGIEFHSNRLCVLY